MESCCNSTFIEHLTSLYSGHTGKNNTPLLYDFNNHKNQMVDAEPVNVRPYVSQRIPYEACLCDMRQVVATNPLSKCDPDLHLLT